MLLYVNGRSVFCTVLLLMFSDTVKTQVLVYLWMRGMLMCATERNERLGEVLTYVTGRNVINYNSDVCFKAKLILVDRSYSFISF